MARRKKAGGEPRVRRGRRRAPLADRATRLVLGMFLLAQASAHLAS